MAHCINRSPSRKTGPPQPTPPMLRTVPASRARRYEAVPERTAESRSATSAQFTMFHRAVT